MSLLEMVGLLLERTYDVDVEIGPLGRFVVGDEGYRRLTERRRIVHRIEHEALEARLLVRPVRGCDSWAVALYLPDQLVAHLERLDPRRGINAYNVDAFATLVEETDHLITFADTLAAGGREVSLLELEWHAAVSKHLVLSHFIGRLEKRKRLTDRARAFIEHHLFHKPAWSDADPAVEERYRRATCFGYRFVHKLAQLPPADRLSELRRFHRASHHEKLRRYAA